VSTRSAQQPRGLLRQPASEPAQAAGQKAGQAGRSKIPARQKVSEPDRGVQPTSGSGSPVKEVESSNPAPAQSDLSRSLPGSLSMQPAADHTSAGKEALREWHRILSGNPSDAFQSLVADPCESDPAHSNFIRALECSGGGTPTSPISGGQHSHALPSWVGGPTAVV